MISFIFFPCGRDMLIKNWWTLVTIKSNHSRTYRYFMKGLFFFMHELTEIWLAASIVPLSEKAGPRDLAKSALYKISSLYRRKNYCHPTAYCKKHCSVTFHWVVTLQGAKKVIFKACHSGKLELACTSPNIISTSHKNILMSRIDFTVLL